VVPFYATTPVPFCSAVDSYDGNGADEMWVDRLFFEDSFAKAKAPPSGCSYRIVLQTWPGEPPVSGVSFFVLRFHRPSTDERRGLPGWALPKSGGWQMNIRI
jgi:hypothetical protein